MKSRAERILKELIDVHKLDYADCQDLIAEINYYWEIEAQRGMQESLDE